MTDSGRRWVLVAALVPLCWLGMQVVHGAGHVIAGWITGGTVKAVVLHPLVISRTDVEPNASPLVVVWAGPVVGVAAPILAWLAVRALRWSSAYLWRFFAGFCLVANGAYIGSGAFAPVGDAADLVRLGASEWSLGSFGVIAFAAGLALWNGLGLQFSFGREPGAIPAVHVWAVVASLVVLVAAELVWSGVTGFR